MSKKWRRIENDNLPQEKYESWLDKTISNLMKYLKNKRPFYIWQGYLQLGVTQRILERLGCVISTLIVWKKPSPSISFADYNLSCEQSWYGFNKGEGRHPWFGSKSETTLWEVDREKRKELIHPTQKPVELFIRAIKNSSKRNDIILDAVLGSGTSLIASQKMGRRCYGMEIDPYYVDAIVRRYVAFVGKDNVSDEVKKKYLKEA